MYHVMIPLMDHTGVFIMFSIELMASIVGNAIHRDLGCSAHTASLSRRPFTHGSAEALVLPTTT